MNEVDKFIADVENQFMISFENRLNEKGIGRKILEDLLVIPHPFCSDCPLIWFFQFFVGKRIYSTLRKINEDIKIYSKHGKSKAAFKVAMNAYGSNRSNTTSVDTGVVSVATEPTGPTQIVEAEHQIHQIDQDYEIEYLGEHYKITLEHELDDMRPCDCQRCLGNADNNEYDGWNN